MSPQKSRKTPKRKREMTKGKKIETGTRGEMYERVKDARDILTCPMCILLVRVELKGPIHKDGRLS